MNSVYDSDTVPTTHKQFWFRQLRFCNFDAKYAPYSAPIVGNIEKIIEIIESDRYVRYISIAQQLTTGTTLIIIIILHEVRCLRATKSIHF